MKLKINQKIWDNARPNYLIFIFLGAHSETETSFWSWPNPGESGNPSTIISLPDAGVGIIDLGVVFLCPTARQGSSIWQRGLPRRIHADGRLNELLYLSSSLSSYKIRWFYVGILCFPCT